jgi:hypothetical protein
MDCARTYNGQGAVHVGFKSPRFSVWRAVRAATLHHPWFRCGPAATSCSGVRRMRLTLPSPGDGGPEARLRSASRISRETALRSGATASLRFPAPLADRPKHPCLGVRHNVAHPCSNPRLDLPHSDSSHPGEAARRRAASWCASTEPRFAASAFALLIRQHEYNS